MTLGEVIIAVWRYEWKNNNVFKFVVCLTLVIILIFSVSRIKKLVENIREELKK